MHSKDFLIFIFVTMHKLCKVTGFSVRLQVTLIICSSVIDPLSALFFFFLPHLALLLIAIILR